MWSQYGIGIRLRAITGRGEPDAGVVLVKPEGDCAESVSIAADGKLQAIVYSAGCGQRDLLLRTRDRAGAVSEPIALASEP